MKTPLLSLRLLVLLGFVLLALVGRVALPYFPHLPNFAPLDAIALFSGAYLARRWQAVLVPLLSVWLSDIVLNYQYSGHLELFYGGFYWQYGTYAVLALLAGVGLRRVTPLRVAVVGVGAAVLFFLVSNFGVWVGSTLYAHTLSGLAACYVAALPFFNHSLVSNLVFGTVLFGGFELLQRQVPVLARPEVTAA